MNRQTPVKQECIPVGCILSTTVPVLGWGCLPGGVVCPEGAVCLGGTCPDTPPCEQNHRQVYCKNLTFPQLLLRTVKITFPQFHLRSVNIETSLIFQCRHCKRIASSSCIHIFQKNPLSSFLTHYIAIICKFIFNLIIQRESEAKPSKI